MTYKYLLNVLTSLVVVFFILIIYYQSQTQIEMVDQTYSRTEYLETAVPGSIQPLPEVIKFDEGWADLGKALFHSPLLSADNSTSCATCHSLVNAGVDGFPVSVGIHGVLGSRNAPSVLNAVFNFRQFWDGRSADLQEQVVGPIHNPIEMGSNWAEIIEKLSTESDFVYAFNALSEDGITAENIIRAIVTFEETLVTPSAPIDKYLLGHDTALSQVQKRGLEKFIGFGCVSCHQGKNIGGNLYQKIGRIDQVPAKLLEDLGRYELTKNESDMHVFKVPSLRNVALTAPYFHNGSVETLEEAVKIMARGQLGIELTDEDIFDLVSLLHAFTGKNPVGGP